MTTRPEDDLGLDGRPGRQTAPLALDLPCGHGEGILVVDDDPDICLSTKFLLERLGYRVLTAHNGAEAVGLWIEKGQYALTLIVVDEMPRAPSGGTEQRNGDDNQANLQSGQQQQVAVHGGRVHGPRP